MNNSELKNIEKLIDNNKISQAQVELSKLGAEFLKKKSLDNYIKFDLKV